MEVEVEIGHFNEVFWYQVVLATGESIEKQHDGSRSQHKPKAALDVNSHFERTLGVDVLEESEAHLQKCLVIAGVVGAAQDTR
eukprot:gene14155-5156_t